MDKMRKGNGRGRSGGIEAQERGLMVTKERRIKKKRGGEINKGVQNCENREESGGE